MQSCSLRVRRMGRVLATEAVRAVALVLGRDPYAGPDAGDLYQFGIFYGASMLQLHLLGFAWIIFKTVFLRMAPKDRIGPLIP